MGGRTGQPVAARSLESLWDDEETAKAKDSEALNRDLTASISSVSSNDVGGVGGGGTEAGLDISRLRLLKNL